MRARIMTMFLFAAAMLLGLSPARAEEPAVSEQSATTDSGPESVETATTTATAEPKAVRIPPGFRKKQRGKYTVYCRKEQVMGTRMEQEKCYDERGLREMEVALRENQEKVDQMRRICGSMEACGGGG